MDAGSVGGQLCCDSSGNVFIEVILVEGEGLGGSGDGIEGRGM